MQNYKQILSKDNALIKKVVKLAKDSKFRQDMQLAVIYGEHLVIEAICYGLIADLFILDSKIDKYLPFLTKLNAASIYMLNSELMAKINLLDTPTDIVATVKIKPEDDLGLVSNQDCLILERIQDPGNLGTILRAANASGIKNVVLSKFSVDVYNPKVLRASQGIQFGLNIFSNVDLDQFITDYKGQLLALTPHAKNDLYAQDLTKTTALVLGNEGEGLSKDLLNRIKDHITIPMMGNSESLNLAMAATISIFEMSRQRLKRHKN